LDSTASFTISAFGDEIAADPAQQLDVLRELRVGFLELRGAWGTNVLHMDDAQVATIRRLCAERNMAVSCIGSPIGKSPLTDPIEKEAMNLRRIFQIAEVVGTHYIRVFSFYPPDTSTNAEYDQYVGEAASRLAHLAAIAQREGFTLLLENEKEIVGDTLARCHALVSGVDSPHLRFLWDPANFVQVSEARPTDEGWSLLGVYVSYVHIKDAVLDDGSIRPAGEGDGQVDALLRQLRDAGYQGVLALEPHLDVAGHSGGFSGADGMRRAVRALRGLMAEAGCEEKPAEF
jgi:sugar phosphate isomerase/epimerase